MKFILDVKTPHKIEAPYIFDNLLGTFTGDYFCEENPRECMEEPGPLLEIVLGYDCNGNCLYCDQEAIRSGNGAALHPGGTNITRFTERLKALLDRDMPSSCLDGILWGGEGLLYFDTIKGIYNSFKEFRKTKWRIPTNAKLLKGKIFQWIVKRPDIDIQVSHDGRDTLEFRGYDPFNDKEVFQNLRILQDEGRLIFNPVLHIKTTSREDTALYIEEKMGSECIFGDMKFVYPTNDDIFNRFSISEENLRKFQKRELELLFNKKEYLGRDFIKRIAYNIWRNINKKFVLSYHRDVSQNKHLIVHLDGSLVWAHSQHPKQMLGENEFCGYGSLWNMDKKPLTPPLIISELFSKHCASCPILAFGDRGCACLMQYNQKHIEYYCKTQRARILPIFSRLFYDMTDAFITSIKPMPEPYNVQLLPSRP